MNSSGSPLHLRVLLRIHAKNPDYRGCCLCGLQGIKIHFREFLYDFALRRNKLPGVLYGI
jgi:hypothetical protein